MAHLPHHLMSRAVETNDSFVRLRACLPSIVTGRDPQDRRRQLPFAFRTTRQWPQDQKSVERVGRARTRARQGTRRRASTSCPSSFPSLNDVRTHQSLSYVHVKVLPSSTSHQLPQILFSNDSYPLLRYPPKDPPLPSHNVSFILLPPPRLPTLRPSLSHLS
jgi:hypothetical protein